MVVCAQADHSPRVGLPRDWSDLSMAQARALVWRKWAAQSPEPPSLSALARSNGKDKPIQLVPDWLHELPEGFVTQDQLPIGLHS